MKSSIPESFLIFIFTVMNTVGVVGYWFGFDYYIRPSATALIIIAVSISCFYFAWITYVVFKKKSNWQAMKATPPLKARMADYVFLAVLSFIAFYSYLYFDSFSVSSILSGSDEGESGRPDVVGNIPYYWSFTVILTGLGVPLAINKLLLSSGSIKVFWWGILISLSLIIGDKSLILSILFFILFIVGRLSVKKIFYFILLFLVVYAGVKYAYYSQTHEIEAFLDPQVISESILRRVSFINASAMGVVVDQLVLEGGSLSGFANLKQYVFYHIYGFLPGGAPVPFVVSSFYFLPIIYGFIFVYFSTLFVLIVRGVIARAAVSEVYFAVLYLNFYGAIVLTSGSLFDYFIRSFIPSIMIVIAGKILAPNILFIKQRSASAIVDQRQ